jgi:hypothetical protein
MPSSHEQLAVDAWFRQWGKPASYQPPVGAAIPCKVIVRNADHVLGLDHGAPLVVERVLEVRASEIAVPVRNGVFTRQDVAEVYTVIGDPETRDDLRLIWTLRYRV